MTVRVGVIGTGFIGERHLACLDRMPNVEIVSTYDVIEATSRIQATRYKARAYSSPTELLDRSKPDAVLVCTPPRWHLEMTSLAAERGVHVFCEKPMAGSVEDCEQMIATCADHGVRLMIGFKKRFDPYYSFAVRLLKESGRQPMFASVSYLVGRVDKDWYWGVGDGAGPVVETACHQYDLLRCIFGEVESVYAAGGTYFMKHRAPVSDVAAVALKFKSGAAASLSIGYATEFSINREEVLYASDSHVVELRGAFEGANELRYVDRRRPNDIYGVSLADAEPGGTGIKEELEHFIECVGTGHEPLATGADGLKAMQIAFAIVMSIETGKPVALD